MKVPAGAAVSAEALSVVNALQAFIAGNPII